MIVRLMKKQDVDQAAWVHAEAFVRQERSKEWLLCSIHAFPRLVCYVVEYMEQVCGYIIWAQKSGFRPEAVVELEQIAVHPSFQNKGVGKQLITQSFKQLKEQLLLSGSSIKHILVNTRADNSAQKLYQNVLGAKVEARINNLFSADEVYMVARNVRDFE